MRSPFALLVCALALSIGTSFPALAQEPPGASPESRPRCAGCGETIGPGRYMQDQWKDAYHVEHAKLSRCDYCGRGISPHTTGGGVRYADGREVCNPCQQTAVMDTATAETLLERTRSRMAVWGLKIPTGRIPVELVDKDTLEQRFGRKASHGGMLNGLTTKKRVQDPQGRVLKREISIAMLYGLPRLVFEQTMAHELMHAWMFLDKQPDHAPGLEEGTCNLASYYLLQEEKGEFAGFLRQALVKSPDPIYGEGLRRAIRFVQGHEFPGLVQMLRRSADWPPE